MRYQNFIKTLQNHQTNNVKALPIPASCSMTQIPDTFSLLLPDIVRIINLNVSKLCGDSKTIAVFGFQISSIPITSKLPQILKRIVDHKKPGYHFCCNLSYLIMETAQLEQVQSWENAQTLVIDFTTGRVMDTDCYLAEILWTKDTGRIYGYLDETLLKRAWQAEGLKLGRCV